MVDGQPWLRGYRCDDLYVFDPAEHLLFAAPMRIRPYDSTDAQATLRIFLDAVTVTAARHYTPEQIAAWAGPDHRDPAEWDRARHAQDSYVALIGDQPAGFAGVDTGGHIDMMFVSPRYARQGVARELLVVIEDRLWHSGARHLSADVSIAARPFFEAHGFRTEAEQHPVMAGVVMTNFRMTKPLVVD